MSHIMKNITPAALSALVLALAAGSADAQIVNGNFDDLTGWSTAGDATSVAVGGTHLVLTNAFSDGSDDDTADGRNHNLSGQDPLQTGGGAGSLEGFLGLGGGALDPMPGSLPQAVEGSAAQQTFSVAAGGSLSFQWSFGTTETDPAQADYAFVVIDGTVHGLTDTLPTSAGTDYALQTGWTTFTQALGAGTHTIAFGVVDVDSFNDSSALSVSDVALGVSAVPESSTLAMFGAGLGLLALARRRRNA
jgi:hypothetical protein